MPRDREKQRAAQRRYDRKRSQTEAYKQRRREYMKEYEKRPDVKKRRKEYSQTEAYKKRKKEYRQRPHIKQRKYNQRKHNPAHKRRKYLRSIVRLAVIKQTGVSAKTCNDLIGCTAQQARDHLEQQFEPWMNWNNYGSGSKKWCIDHIVSGASIDIFDEKEVKKIFHYTNMQPLGFIKNSEKGHRA